MKNRVVLICTLSALLCSCQSDTAVEPSNLHTDSSPIVNISAGNTYTIHYFNFSGVAVVDWYQTKSILRDTIIAGNKYGVFSTGEILRSTSSAVLQWNGSSENVFYRFDVQAGDTVTYQGRILMVTSIVFDTVFVGTQKIIEASNSGLNPDTLVAITYAAKFGLLMTRKSVAGRTWSSSLSGAKIDTVKYGSL